MSFHNHDAEEKPYKRQPDQAVHSQISTSDYENFRLLEEYDMKERIEKVVKHTLEKVPGEYKEQFLTNFINGMLGSAIIHFNDRYVRKLNVPDFKKTFK